MRNNIFVRSRFRRIILMTIEFVVLLFIFLTLWAHTTTRYACTFPKQSCVPVEYFSQNVQNDSSGLVVRGQRRTTRPPESEASMIDVTVPHTATEDTLVTVASQEFEETALNTYPNMTEEEFIAEYIRYCELMLNPNVSSQNSTTPPCPCVPKDLVGPIPADLTVPGEHKLEEVHKELRLGGSWSPPDCQPRHTVAIIIPYRDRHDHLFTQLGHLHPILQRQRLSYRIFVVEQEGDGVFNKAMLMNIGFLEARKQQKFDCYIFHDVDVLTRDDRNMYTCAHHPRHVGAYMDRHNYTVKYITIFGAATAFTEDQFTKVNGFSNTFYGWGGEDDDMSSRVRKADYTIVRYPRVIAKFDAIPHAPDDGNPRKTHLIHGRRKTKANEDGFPQTDYNVTSITTTRLYTRIVAKVPDRFTLLESWLGQILGQGGAEKMKDFLDKRRKKKGKKT